MATQKIAEAIRQLHREGDRPLRDAATKELASLRRAIRDIVRFEDEGGGPPSDRERAWKTLRAVADEE